MFKTKGNDFHRSNPTRTNHSSLTNGYRRKFWHCSNENRSDLIAWVLNLKLGVFFFLPFQKTTTCWTTEQVGAREIFQPIAINRNNCTPRSNHRCRCHPTKQAMAIKFIVSNNKLSCPGPGPGPFIFLVCDRKRLFWSVETYADSFYKFILICYYYCFIM